MSREPIVASLQSVRRLAVTKQHLAGKVPARATTAAVVRVVRDTAFIQWDPVTVVSPSHMISMWARLGDFRPADLERLLWREKRLFLHWIPIAALVLTEDYPLYYSMMRRYPESLSKSWGSQRAYARTFLAGHSKLRRKILAALRKGPLQVGQFEDHSRTPRNDGEWGSSSDVSLMLYLLLMRGEVMVVGHEGGQNLWGLSESFLPSWVDKGNLSGPEFEELAAQRALRALGTATRKEIQYHFPRGMYHDLPGALARLEAMSTIHRVKVDELGHHDERYIHAEDVRALESMTTAAWQPRMSLLPPFDNMVGSQERLNRLFGFDYIREQFLPKEKRKFGTYVLPILHGDRFIGRIDPRLDKTKNELVINSVHAEPGAPTDRETAAEIGETIERLGRLVGATQVTYTRRVPEPWKSSLR